MTEIDTSLQRSYNKDITKKHMQQIALVTGSSKGIGKSIANELAKNGYYVYITYKTDKDGASEKRRIKNPINL